MLDVLKLAAHAKAERRTIFDCLMETEDPKLKTVAEKIAELVKEKRIEGISDIRDESDRQGVRVVIEIKREFQADVVLNQLYKYTQLQTSFGMNMLAINNGRPMMMTDEH